MTSCNSVYTSYNDDIEATMDKLLVSDFLLDAAPRLALRGRGGRIKRGPHSSTPGSRYRCRAIDKRSASGRAE